ncbi:MAG: GAF domain-containing protein [Anaerolineales bacterium]|nr:GAF domain-containing protein [Anaerolineales bacterium]
MNKQQTQPAQSEVRRKRYALVISLVTGVVFTIIAAASGVVGYMESGVRGLWGVSITGVVAIAAFTSAYLSRRGRSILGILVLISTILFMSLAIPIAAHGQGLPLSIMVAIIVAGVSSATLPTRIATRTITAGFIVSALITLADLYLPDFGLPTNPALSNTIAIVTSVAFAGFILSRFNSYALRTKIIIAFILITIIPLIALGIFNSRFSRQTLEEESKSQLTTLAKLVADRVDGFITNELNSILSDSKQSAFTTYLETPASLRAGSEAESNARLSLLALTRKDPIFIHSVALLDPVGNDVLDTFSEYEGRFEGYYTYFVRPLQTGLPYASNVVFRNSNGNIYFTAPIKSQSGNIIGLLRIEYHATVLQTILRAIDPGDPGTIIAIIDTNTYIRVGYTGNRDSLFKSYKNYSDIDLLALQADGRLPSGPRENALRATDDAVVNGIDNLAVEPFFNAFSNSLGTDAVNTGVFLQTQPWIALVRQSINDYLAPVKEQDRTTILISLVLIVLSIGAGFLTSQVLISPLVSLSKVAEKIAGGDIHARAAVSTEDEVGALSESFNRMTDELNHALSSLETRVAERTTDLELAQLQSEERANELQAIGEISKIITGEQKLETLLPLITRLVSERFGFYHTGIFLIEETGQFAVLQASNSEGGRNMLDRGHKLEVGGSGIVGFVAKTGAPRISLDVGLDAVYFNNPDLPNTRSEMALPLISRGKTIGVLDIQSDKPGAFTDNDTQTLGILADQISTALENARLFTQTQVALQEAQTLYQQNIKEGWSAFSREESLIGYRQNMKGGKRITKPVETDDIQQALNRGEVTIFHADGVSEEATIVVPIKLRGQVIGSLNVKAPARGRQWSSDEVNLAEIVSERLSIALENARLIQESQRQVIKEQTISDITGKIGASINLKSVLQTAVEELGRAMPGSEVIIQFEKNGQ